MFHKLSQRELAAYYLAYTLKEINYGEFIDTLANELCMTKRTARNVFKRLKKLGLVRIEDSGDSLLVVCVSPQEILSKHYEQYRESRRKKCYALAKKKVEQ